MTGTKNTQNQQKNVLLPALAATCLLALSVMICALIFTGRSAKNQAAFTPPLFDSAAVKGSPEMESGTSDRDRLQQLGYSSMDAVDYRVAVCGAPVIEDGKAVLYLTNPETNQVWIKVRLLDESGQTLGESGLLRQGEYTEFVTLDMNAVKDAQAAQNVSEEPGIAVLLRIMAYEPETYHSAGTVSLSTVLMLDGDVP